MAVNLIDEIAAASGLDPEQRREFQDRATRLATADVAALDAEFAGTFAASQKERHSPVRGAVLTYVTSLKEAKVEPERKAAQERALAREAKDRSRSALYHKLSTASPADRPAILREIETLGED